MSVQPANPAHEVAYQDLCQLIRKHADTVSGLELLAIAANLVGKLVAMQDQRTISPALAMETVALNIEYGNRMVLDELAQNTAGRG